MSLSLLDIADDAERRAHVRPTFGRYAGPFRSSSATSPAPPAPPRPKNPLQPATLRPRLWLLGTIWGATREARAGRGDLGRGDKLRQAVDRARVEFNRTHKESKRPVAFQEAAE